MILGLTGTPGTGKTTIAQFLEQKGIMVINLKKLAETHNFIDSHDEKRNSNILDLDAIDHYLKSQYSSKEPLVIESHLSHLLNIVQMDIVLRCQPNILKTRLMKRHWPWKKIKENIEAEILDIILSEAIENHGKNNVMEMDTTNMSPKESSKQLHHLLQDMPTQHIVKPGSFDWSEYLFDSDIMGKETHGS